MSKLYKSEPLTQANKDLERQILQKSVYQNILLYSQKHNFYFKNQKISLFKKRF